MNTSKGKPRFRGQVALVALLLAIACEKAEPDAGAEGSGGGQAGAGTAGGVVAGRGGFAAASGGSEGNTSTDAGTGGSTGAAGAAGGTGEGGSGVPDGGAAAADAADEQHDTYNPCPRDSACRVMPLGDSITEGFNDLPMLGGYRTWIWQAATAEGKRLDFVGSNNSRNKNGNRDNPLLPDQDNEGWQGETIIGSFGKLPEKIAAAKPHVILVMLGTNDVTWKQRGVSDDHRARAPERLAMHIDRCTSLAPDALVIVAQIVPPKVPGNLVDAESDTRVRAYNNALVEVVRARATKGKHIELVDLYSDLDPATDMADGLHPNVSGFKKMAARFYARLGPRLR